jgi:hypothetical protein
VGQFFNESGEFTLSKKQEKKDAAEAAAKELRELSSKSNLFSGRKIERSPEEEYENYADSVRADAWLEYVLTGRPSAMATYLAAGGPVDDDIRDIIVDMLRGKTELLNEGGKDHWEDYGVYSRVSSLMLFTGVGVMEACREYIRINGKAIEEKTVWEQYKRGEKIFGGDDPLMVRNK